MTAQHTENSTTISLNFSHLLPHWSSERSAIRGFPASWPCAGWWIGEGQHMGRWWWESRRERSFTTFPLVFLILHGTMLRLGLGLTSLRARDHQRKHPSSFMKRQHIHLQSPHLQDLGVPRWALLSDQDWKALDWGLLEVLASQRLEGVFPDTLLTEVPMAAPEVPCLLSLLGSPPILLFSCPSTLRSHLVFQKAH